MPSPSHANLPNGYIPLALAINPPPTSRIPTQQSQNPLERTGKSTGRKEPSAAAAQVPCLLPQRPTFAPSILLVSRLSVSMAASTKTVVVLAVVLLALVASAAASRKLEEDAALLGNLAPAPSPAQGAAAGIAPGAWAVAALVSLVAFLAH